MEQKHMSRKAALKIVAGSILAAYGLTLAVYAGFGGATLAIFWQGGGKPDRAYDWRRVACGSGGHARVCVLL